MNRILDPTVVGDRKRQHLARFDDVPQVIRSKPAGCLAVCCDAKKVEAVVETVLSSFLSVDMGNQFSGAGNEVRLF